MDLGLGLHKRVFGFFADGGDRAVVFVGEFGVVGLHGACSWADAGTDAGTDTRAVHERDVDARVDVFGKLVQDFLWHFHLVKA